MEKTLSTTLKAALFIFLMSFVAWITGNFFIFPSLGPTAYILAFDRKISHSASVVIGGHACGVLGGLAAYYLIVDPYNLLMLTEAFSFAGLYLGLGSVLAVAITTFLMIWFNVSHPPACATTLIISLGILPEWIDGIIILLAVGILYLGYWIFQKATKDPKV
ncbi:MAG: HPP family protein [Balneolaceae bacterium]